MQMLLSPHIYTSCTLYELTHVEKKVSEAFGISGLIITLLFLYLLTEEAGACM